VISKRILNRLLIENTFKVTTVALYLEHLTPVIAAYSDKIMAEYNRKHYLKHRFSKYINKQKAYHMMYMRLRAGMKRTQMLLIGYGSGSVNGSGIGGATMPVKGFYEYLCRQPYVKVIKINENYTTKMCFECWGENGYVYEHKDIVENGEVQRKKCKIYGLRRCRNNGCRITWDRDYCAARNIRYILSSEHCGKQRPRYLCKGIDPQTDPMQNRIRAETS